MVTQQQWRAQVELARPERTDARRLEQLTRTLPGFAIVRDDAGAGRLAAEMTVEAATLRQAADAAVRAAREAGVAAFGEHLQLLALRVLTVEDFDRELARPRRLELVGLREAAALLRVSPQRAGQLADEHPEFPAPVAELAAGRVYTRASIEAFDRGWSRKRTGRPRKSAA